MPKLIPVERGIRRTADGRYVAYVRVHDSPLKYRRFKAGASIGAVRRWRRDTRTSLEYAAEQAPPPDTIGQHLEAYLATLVDRPILRAERRRQLAWWMVAFADRPAATIGAIDIRVKLSGLRTTVCRCTHARDRHEADGTCQATTNRRTHRGAEPNDHPCRCGGFHPLTAATCNKYRYALLAFYQALGLLDPATHVIVNPVADVPIFDPPKPEPRALSYDLVRLILDSMSDLAGTEPDRHRLAGSKAKARCRVFAWTGIRHSELKRFLPSDWNRVQHTLFVRTGKGGSLATIPLCAEAESALEELLRCEAIGPFSNSTVHRAFRAALRLVNADLPPAQQIHARPYDLRHTFGTWMYQATGDLRIVKELMRHAHQRTTERYTLGYVPAYMWTATQRFAELTAPGAAPPPDLSDVDRARLRVITGGK